MVHIHTHTHAHTRYLTENLSPPSTIPISVKLTFPEKGFEASDIVLKPDETMASIVKRLQSLMVEKGMEIVHFPPLDEIEMSFVRYANRFCLPRSIFPLLPSLFSPLLFLLSSSLPPH